MTTTFEPELGQMVFGQPYKQYAVPEIAEAAFMAIANELDRVMGNIHQRDYENPFNNTGNRFECPVFKVHAYSWSDDEQPWNFKWGDLEVSWYKWCGRGASSNMPITPDMASQFLEECLAAVRRFEEENDRTRR